METKVDDIYFFKWIIAKKDTVIRSVKLIQTLITLWIAWNSFKFTKNQYYLISIHYFTWFLKKFCKIAITVSFKHDIIALATRLCDVCVCGFSDSKNKRKQKTKKKRTENSLLYEKSQNYLLILHIHRVVVWKSRSISVALTHTHPFHFLVGSIYGARD